ncbi:polysaccharide biosynthesis tyrosine autokinase [Paraburkholderia phymatum]|nr:polysaccharide biosynthesis tyrosine autokinase [Paraburkholderia phymatum]
MIARNIEMKGEPGRGDEDAFVAADLGRLIVDNIWVVTSIAALVFVASLLNAYFATPMYDANAVLRVDLPNPNGLGIALQAPQVAQPVPLKLPTDVEIEMVQSRNVLLPVIEQFRLNISVTPRSVPLLAEVTGLFSTRGVPMPPVLGLRSFAWGGEDVHLSALRVPRELENEPLRMLVLEGGRYRLDDPNGRPVLAGTVGAPATGDGVSITVDRMAARPGTRFTVVRYSDVDAIARLHRQLQVMELGKDTGVIQILYESSDPLLAMHVTDAIAKTYVAAHIAQRREEASETLAFVDGELPRLRDELRQAEVRLSDYQTAVGSIKPDPESTMYLQGSLDFAREIANVRLQRTRLLEQFTPDSAQVRTADNQLKQLISEKEAFEARFSTLPLAVRTTADLTRDVKAANDIYLAMLNKSHELDVTRAGTLGNVHIVDTALWPSRPVKPKRLLIVASGAGAGVILGVLFVFVRQQYFNGVREPLSVERRLRLPVFGAIRFSNEQARLDYGAERIASPETLAGDKLGGEPHTRDHAGAIDAGLSEPEGLREPGVAAHFHRASHEASNHARTPSLARKRHATGAPLALYRPADLAMEQLRDVRTALECAVAVAPNKILLVTGATPGTGKSFVSANLAVLASETGKRVLLIDADMRRGVLASHFGLPASNGLAELLAGHIMPLHAIQPTCIDGMSLLATGLYPPNPSALLATQRMRNLLQVVSEQFDLVIVDTPPVLAVTDANILAAHAGATLLVLRPNVQTQSELEETLRRLDRAGANLIGAVFNAMPQRRSEKRWHAYASAYTANANQMQRNA